MRSRRKGTFLGLGLACLSMAGCASALKMGGMWVGKKAIKEAVKTSHKSDDAKHSKHDETDSDAPASQPASADKRS